MTPTYWRLNTIAINLHTFPNLFLRFCIFVFEIYWSQHWFSLFDAKSLPASIITILIDANISIHCWLRVRNILFYFGRKFAKHASQLICTHYRFCLDLTMNIELYTQSRHRRIYGRELLEYKGVYHISATTTPNTVVVTHLWPKPSRWGSNDVLITSKRRHFDIITSK